MPNAFATLLHAARDLALPARCGGCGAVLGVAHRFCAKCWSSLDFLAPPWCARCNRPFAHDRGERATCAECLAQPPLHAGIRAAVAYGDVARTLALRLKYGGRTGDAVTAAGLMRRYLPQRCDLLVPVPLHRWRLWSRGYNQAGLIATALGAAGDVAVDAHALERTRATPVLRGLGASERHAALRGAFRVNPAAARRIAGRALALIDDVHTSGATAQACTAALLEAGAASVTVLAWARVIDRRDERD